MNGYIVIVYHFGELLLRNDDGVVEYINGRVDELTEVDAGYVNLKDLESIFKGYGYEKCDRIMWLKPGAPDLEHGLQPLCLDSDINAMCAAALANGNKIHIYFDHCIAVPDIISPVEEDHGMFSHEEEYDSYESAEDEAYKPPPPEDYEAGDDEAEDYEEQCRPKKKKTDRQSNDDSNEDVSEEESLVHEEEANKEEANDSFDENGYEYDSEELKTPCSSDDEEHDNETLAQFNEKAEFGHVYLELGIEFVSLQQFKDAIKDYNISLGRQFIWLKNDKQRARARCSVKECEWVIFCGWDNKCHTWLMSQGGPAPEVDSQPARGSSPQPSIPTESSHLPSEERMRAASNGTRARFMSTPGFRAPRQAP